MKMNSTMMRKVMRRRKTRSANHGLRSDVGHHDIVPKCHRASILHAVLVHAAALSIGQQQCRVATTSIS